MSDRQAGANFEVLSRVGLEGAVEFWLTSHKSLHRDGGLGDVRELVQTILPHVRIFPAPRP